MLLAALRRTEAGALHALVDRPRETALSDHPWRILLAQAPEHQQGAAPVRQAASAPGGHTLDILRRSLTFRYPHQAATRTPSKQTATGRKGRFRDEEAAEQTPRAWSHTWRQPTFRQKQDPAAYGTAIHAVLQFIRYDSCGSPGDVDREIARLVRSGHITDAQGRLADSAAIAAFFQTGLGQKLRQGVPHLREFKFSILDDARDYGGDLDGEQVLLQGVVDCALLEPDGITVIDFKTDYVTQDTLPTLLDRYRPQVEAYATALSRIYQKPIKGRYLYLFHLGRLEPL